MVGSSSLCRQRRFKTSSAKPRKIIQQMASREPMSSTNLSGERTAQWLLQIHQPPTLLLRCQMKMCLSLTWDTFEDPAKHKCVLTIPIRVLNQTGFVEHCEENHSPHGKEIPCIAPLQNSSGRAQE